MKCPLFGRYVVKGTRLPGWRLDQKEPTPRKGTPRINPSQSYGGGLPWTRGSNLYKEAAVEVCVIDLSIRTATTKLRNRSLL